MCECSFRFPRSILLMEVADDVAVPHSVFEDPPCGLRPVAARQYLVTCTPTCAHEEQAAPAGHMHLSFLAARLSSRRPRAPRAGGNQQASWSRPLHRRRSSDGADSCPSAGARLNAKCTPRLEKRGTRRDLSLFSLLRERAGC